MNIPAIDINKIWEYIPYNPQIPMVFNSGFFLFFFFFVFSFYLFVYKNVKLRVALLTIASLYFYYKSSGIYFVLLLFTAFLDFIFAIFIDRTDKKGIKKLLIFLSVFSNLGVLAYFKYTNFFIDIFNNASNSSIGFLDIFLPVGISFFTFQSLSYTIDVYRGQLKPIYNFIDFVFFVSFFPQLVAGPIVRAVDFIPQIKKHICVTDEQIGKAVYLIIAGLFKKAVIADYISTNFVDRVFDNPTLYSGIENLTAIYGYAIQIYCDFSGYSDIAIGLALIMGFELRINFRSPYQSSTITEFWRRWHISLSSWLKDYLYISLGGNQKGKFRQYFNLLATMLLGGLWHGASFKFIVWGALHGVALVFDKLFFSFFKFKSTIFTRIIGIIITFHIVCLSWIFFRADSFNTGFEILNQIFFSFNGELFFSLISGYPLVITLILVGFILHFMPESLEIKTQLFFEKMPVVFNASLLFVIVWMIMQIKSSEIQPFIYFQF